MLNLSVRIAEETADMNAVFAVRENRELSVASDSNEEINRSAVDQFCRIARKDHEWLSQPKDDRSEDRSQSTNEKELDSGSTAWEQKVITFMGIAEGRRDWLLWRAQRITNNREVAEDIVQEALLKGFRHLPQFRGESMMCTWLVAIVQNVGREWLRSQKRRAHQPLENVRDGDEVPLLDQLPDLCEDPEQSCERREMNDILLSEMDELDSVCKHALRMCAIEERSHREAANALGISVSAIKSRIFHGKQMLKRAVQTRTGERGEFSRSFVPTVQRSRPVISDTSAGRELEVALNSNRRAMPHSTRSDRASHTETTCAE